MNRMLCGSVAVLLCSAFSTFAASTSLDIAVAAGPHERNNVPVRVPVSLAGIGNANLASVTLTGLDGKVIPAQLTKSGDSSTLHFILSHLPAGESVRLKATLST